jgi:hypothetical protein
MWASCASSLTLRTISVESALDCKSTQIDIPSPITSIALIAQLVERVTSNDEVAGSTPS